MIDKADNLATIILAAIGSAPEGETESTVARIIRHHRRLWLDDGFRIARDHFRLNSIDGGFLAGLGALDAEKQR